MDTSVAAARRSLHERTAGAQADAGLEPPPAGEFVPSTVGDEATIPSALDAEPATLPARSRWAGWRLRVLLAAVLLGCLGVFALTSTLASLPHLDARWREDRAGQVRLAQSDDPILRPFEGRALVGLAGAGQSISLIDTPVLQRSARWIVDDAERARYIALHQRVGAMLAQPAVQLVFAEGDRLEIRPTPLGLDGLGATFWLLALTALSLSLVATTAPLAQPSAPSWLYALMAWCQTGNLLFIAVESAPQLNLPSGFAPWEAQLRTAFDLATAAAAVHVAALHPTRLPGARALALSAWAGAAVLGALAVGGGLAGTWWNTQLAGIGGGLLALALLTWSYRLEPHPFAMLVRRFGVIAVGTLALLTAAVAAAAGRPALQHDIAGVGSVVWYVLFAALLLLVPLLSRTQLLLRELSLLAAITTVATSLHLLFGVVLGLGQVASLTLALFIGLGIYATARQWLLDRLHGSIALSTERMFEQIYRIAREVESQPQRAAEQLARLLRDLFEPLEVRTVEAGGVRSRVVAHGATLVVPVPELDASTADDAPPTRRSIVVRYARRGRRLFTREDARLTDRVVEQLGRAIAFDKAVERGRSEERTRIAQDLHDDIGARLLTLMYKAPTPEMEDYVRHTLQDLKTLTRGLAASSHRLSHAAPEWKADLLQRLSAAHIELGWSLEYDDDLLLTVVQWSGLTRVLRELVSNAIAHAQATRVAVDFKLERDRLDLTVCDNGLGRAPRAWAHGLGLAGVRKRVKQLGGEVEWVELAPHGIACKVRIRKLSQQR